MAMSSAVATGLTLAATAASTGVGVISAIGQAKSQQSQLEAQAAQARYQADVAEQNRQLAEREASAKRQAALENMTAKRQEAARVIGRQRAAMGASGAVLDEGSALDRVADTAEQAELDAINIYNQGIDEAYRSQVNAWNLQNRAGAERAAGEMYDQGAGSAPTVGLLNAAGTAIGGIASMGSTWGRYLEERNSGPYWDKAAHAWSSVKPRH